MDNRLTFNQQNTQENNSGGFEMVSVIRDADGKPTGKTKSYVTDSPFKLWQFYMRHRGKPRKKKEKNLPTGAEASKLLNEVGDYAERKQDEREEQATNGE